MLGRKNPDRSRLSLPEKHADHKGQVRAVLSASVYKGYHGVIQSTLEDGTALVYLEAIQKVVRFDLSELGPE